jgi:hypothetical protein
MAQEIIDIWRRMSMVSTSPKGWNVSRAVEQMRDASPDLDS